MTKTEVIELELLRDGLRKQADKQRRDRHENEHTLRTSDLERGLAALDEAVAVAKAWADLDAMLRATTGLEVGYDEALKKYYAHADDAYEEDRSFAAAVVRLRERTVVR